MSQAAQSNAASHPKRCPKCGDAYRSDALFCPVCGSALVLAHDAEDAQGNGTRDPYLGTEILGHIEIQKLAGIGAMGRVYRAHQRGVDRDVAVKILRREISGNEQLAARFTREAKVASRLSHPHVVQVYLAGQLPDGSMYIVMEFLDGLSLHSVLAASGGEPLPLERTLHIAVQLCDAVGEAHRLDVVHRDIKPENVMLVQRGGDANFVKVLDFGIARLRASDQSMSTAAGLIFGTARYISPEGAQGMSVTPASDVYSLATVFYQLLTGHTPFESEQPVQLLLQHIHEAPPPMHVFVGDAVPQPICDAIMKNLAKDPSKRDADGQAFGSALVEAAHACGIVPGIAPRDSWSARVTLPRRASIPPTQLSEGVEPPPTSTDAREIEAKPAAHIGARTTKWTPSSDLALRMTPTPGPFEPVGPARSSSPLEDTLDDDDLQKAPLHPGSAAMAPVQAIASSAARSPVAHRTEFQEPAVEDALRGRESTDALARHRYSASDTGSSRRSGPALALFGASVIAIAAVFTAIVYFRGLGSRTDTGTDTPSGATDVRRTDTPASSRPSNEAPLPLLSPMASPARLPVATATASAPSAKVRVTITRTPQAPAIGQSVQFAAALSGVDPKSVAGPHFLVQGPGVNTNLPAALEGGLFRASLTFFEPGSFTVIFRGSADARDISGSIGLAVGGILPPGPNVPPILPPPLPSPPASVKWL
ncbi:MAG: protein kinase [Polyangiaceae bacterium]